MLEWGPADFDVKSNLHAGVFITQLRLAAMELSATC
jgi:hypothetical protein